MTQIDWQAYLDGSLTPEERTRAEQILAESEDARREVDGLKSFLSTLREAALNERVPMDRLEALIPAATKPRWNWRLAGVGLAAAATIALFLLIPRGPNVHDDLIETSDPVVAANWVQPLMPFKVPPIRLGGDRPLVLLHHTRTSCCFDFRVKGSIYHVNVFSPPVRTEGKEVTLSTGISARQKGRRVGWSQNDLVFVVAGQNPETSLEVASAASESLQKY